MKLDHNLLQVRLFKKQILRWGTVCRMFIRACHGVNTHRTEKEARLWDQRKLQPTPQGTLELKWPMRSVACCVEIISKYSYLDQSSDARCPGKGVTLGKGFSTAEAVPEGVVHWCRSADSTPSSSTTTSFLEGGTDGESPCSSHNLSSFVSGVIYCFLKIWFKTYGYQGRKAGEGGGGDGMNWETGIDIYTPICMKLITNKNLLCKKIK